MSRHNLVVVLSGRGTNLAALLDAAAREAWTQTFDARVAAVISNEADAAGLTVARAAGVPTVIVEHRAYPSREAFDEALADAIDAFSPSLVILAGFMRVLGVPFVQRFAGRLINIHPSLLPLFPGLHTHRRALAAGVRVHGATVHFVTAEVDSGGIIAQAALAVLPEDDEASLAARVLACEHRLLPRAVRLILQGRVRSVDARVELHGIDGDELTLFAA
jgi:phosphoribosylglycinamide formyltransferase 1